MSQRITSAKPVVPRGADRKVGRVAGCRSQGWLGRGATTARSAGCGVTIARWAGLGGADRKVGRVAGRRRQGQPVCGADRRAGRVGCGVDPAGGGLPPQILMRQPIISGVNPRFGARDWLLRATGGSPAHANPAGKRLRRRVGAVRRGWCVVAVRPVSSVAARQVCWRGWCCRAAMAVRIWLLRATGGPPGHQCPAGKRFPRRVGPIRGAIDGLAVRPGSPAHT
jgi:hypothetical protein